jgi:sterol desaturase/sphingolipid hydroxylase (fatty acid hydroxylase superfamily)
MAVVIEPERLSSGSSVVLPRDAGATDEPHREITGAGARRRAWMSRRVLGGGLVVLGATAAAAYLLPLLGAGSVVQAVPAPLRGLAEHLINKTRHATVLDPYFYLGVFGLFAVERLIPARKQGIFSPGMLQDVIWFLANTLPMSTLIFFYAALLVSFYQEYLGFLTIDAVSTWPTALRVVLVLLIGDFLGWFHHFIRHKVEVFWYFHTIHHSQRQMNMFTDHRVHLVEFMIADTLIFLPSQMFQLSAVSLGYFLIFIRWYTRIYHANLRTNYGFLKHVLVTPQSHRIHHSIEPRHFDKNFGTLFTIWDRMFGTLYRNYDEYPDTGITDERFPLDAGTKRFRRLATYWAQTIYPFRLIRDRFAGWSASRP